MSTVPQNPLCLVPLLPVLHRHKRLQLEPNWAVCQLQAVTSGMSLPLGASEASSVKWAIFSYPREDTRQCLNTHNRPHFQEKP